MADTIVYNQYDKRYNLVDGNDSSEVNDQPDLCDPIGYEPFEQQIIDLLSAGQTLANYLANKYPNGAEPPGDIEEPVPYGLDYMDWKDMQDAITASLKAQYDAAVAKQAQENSKNQQASSPPGEQPAPATPQA